jgi:acetylornithine deacetylase/succinyl-diaminopimelate desuccinylase-like protein
MITQAQLAGYFAYLRFPTISADPACGQAMTDCADWLVGKLAGLGFDAEARPTGGPPVVLAKRIDSPSKKTVLIYGHYDVQPVDPLALWQSEPFDPVMREGLVIARGATDNKGQTTCHLLGTEALLRDRGELPVNLIYLIEGEEEIGSPSFGKFLQAHRDELSCDAILISDTSMAGPGFPAITCGLRGIACLEMKVRGPKMDLHSGMFGGAVANPATVLASLVAQLHSPGGSVAVPGFYDGVLPVDDAERKRWLDLAFGDQAILDATGAPKLAGESDFTAVERLWIRPTAEVNGLTAGYQGDGSKTIIPAQASAKLSFRLVPGQRPGDIAKKVRAHLQAVCPASVHLDIIYDHGGEPFYADPQSKFSQAAQESLKEVYGLSPALTREGLSIPIVSLLQDSLGIDPLLAGLGMPDCQAHAPNETFPLEQLEKGMDFHHRLLELYAEI